MDQVIQALAMLGAAVVGTGIIYGACWLIGWSYRP